MTHKQEEIIDFYKRAKQFCIDSGYGSEIKTVQDRKFENCDAEEFYLEYCYVIFNTGMKNQAAEKMYHTFLNSNFDLETIKHEGKKKAITEGLSKYKEWFRLLKALSDDESRINFLYTLPFIGDITKYHLGRNIGLDVAKPDRHLARIALEYQFGTVQGMCEFIAYRVGERIGTADVIIWRACNLGLCKEVLK